VLAVLLCKLILPISAHAAEFVFRAGVMQTYPQYSTWVSGVDSSSATGRYMPGGGAALTWHVWGRLRFELGATYLVRTFDIETKSALATIDSDNTARFIQVPGLLRFRVSQSISLGAGVYYGRYVGGEVSGLTQYDDGFLADVEVSFPFHGASRLLFNARYSYSAMDDSRVASESIRFRDLQLFAGIRFPLNFSTVVAYPQ
jgi:hypothetical protein